MGDIGWVRTVRPELKPGECKRINRTGKVSWSPAGAVDEGWAYQGLEYEMQVRNGVPKI